MVLKSDLHSTTCFSPQKGSNVPSSDDEASLTRFQALERFGIDLCRVGKMTTERTDFCPSLPSDKNGPNVARSGGTTLEIESGNCTINNDGKRRKEEADREKQNPGRSFATTDSDNEATLVKRQEVLPTKLEALDTLLSSDAPCLPAKGCKANNQNEDVVIEETATRRLLAGVARGGEEAEETSQDISMVVSHRPPPTDHVPGHEMHATRPIDFKTEDASPFDANALYAGSMKVNRAPRGKARVATVMNPNTDSKEEAGTPPPATEKMREEVSKKGLPNHRRVVHFLLFSANIAVYTRNNHAEPDPVMYVT